MIRSLMNSAIERLRSEGRVKQIRGQIDTGSAPASDSDSEAMLEVIGPVPLPFVRDSIEIAGRWYMASNAPSNREEREELVSAIVIGNPESQPDPPLIRIHSTCFTGDVLGSMRCDCGPQLTSAVHQIHDSEAGGMVVYMSAHEGRGIGLWSKAAAYLLQDAGLDTYEANRALGFPDDQRDFGYAAALIHHLLGDRPFRLLTNNPDKVRAMRALGLRGVVQQPHIAGICPQNRRYLRAKREHGHCIPTSALEPHES